MIGMCLTDAFSNLVFGSKLTFECFSLRFDLKLDSPCSVFQILEVGPKSADEVPPGTRLCAYWSQQYRCLYPGTVAMAASPDYEPDTKYAIVEFDDGDSGRIAIQDIRFLTSDYPVVGEFFLEVFSVCSTFFGEYF